MNGIRILLVLLLSVGIAFSDDVDEKDGTPISVTFTTTTLNFRNLYHEQHAEDVINFSLMKERYVQHLDLDNGLTNNDIKTKLKTVLLPVSTVIEIAVEVYYHQTPSNVDRTPILVLQTHDSKPIFRKRILDSGTPHAAYQVHIGSVVYTENAYQSACPNCWLPIRRLVIAADCNYVSIRRIVVKGYKQTAELSLGVKPVYGQPEKDCRIPPFEFCNRNIKRFQSSRCTFIFNKALSKF